MVILGTRSMYKDMDANYSWILDYIDLHKVTQGV